MLFDSFDLRGTPLTNRAVMAPLTRQRALAQNTPNSLMATYYAQRASAGLIITEGTSPSPNDPATLYTSDAQGYTDYPPLAA